MRILDADRQPAEVAELLRRDAFFGTAEQAAAAERILADVKARGDAAVLECTRRWDAPEMRLEAMRVSDAELESARRLVDRAFLVALGVAAENLRDFHQRQLRPDWFASRPGGGWVGQRYRPIDRVGIYVPGGQAVLFSSLLHAGVPAQTAGVREIAVCTPPRRDGTGDPHILAAASFIGLREVYLIGGAQAVAAMAYGTATVRPVDLIAGPGSPFVNHAKRLLFGTVGIDSLAGPSEILIVADDSAHPLQIAADLLSQAEHSVDARAILLTCSRGLADRVLAELERQSADLPTGEVARRALASAGGIVLCADLEQAAELVNLCAPEHLELLTAEPMWLSERIRNAGAIFLGASSPEPLGDYVAGPSHVLPTGGTARFSSPLGVETFLKRSSLIAYSPATLSREAQAIVALARAEGLEAHARSIEARVD